MAQAPGKSFRKGLTIIQLMDMFPTEESARTWFEGLIWADGRHCPHCGSTKTTECDKEKTHPMPYRCNDCKLYFSARIGTVMEDSKLPFRKWVLAIYLHMTSLKGVSSMKLHRDIGVTQKTAWFMLQRIREAFRRDDDNDLMGGPVEVDETYMGGRRKNMHGKKRREAEGRGPVDMTAVVGAKDRTKNEVRAQVVDRTDAATLVPFVEGNAAHGAQVYTDDARAYSSLATMLNGFSHESVNHSAGEYVRDQAHTNGIESFWSVLKRAHKGVYHKFSVKHLQRYVTDFAGRHNVRTQDTLAQMECIVSGMVGKRLTYKALKANNGLPSGARSWASGFMYPRFLFSRLNPDSGRVLLLRRLHGPHKRMRFDM